MKQEFIDYELHLQMFLDAGAGAHARHEVGEPKKPAGYDEYKAKQHHHNQTIETPKDSFSYVKFVENIAKNSTENKNEGLLFDKEGIPQYLNADDHYNGIENPEWKKKYCKETLKPATHKSIENENPGINFDEDGIPEYLNANDRYYGIANPEWVEKHEKNKK